MRVDVSRAVQKVGDRLKVIIGSGRDSFMTLQSGAALTMVSLNDLYLVVTSGPVVSMVGTTKVGIVPLALILKTTRSADHAKNAT